MAELEGQLKALQPVEPLKLQVEQEPQPRRDALHLTIQPPQLSSWDFFVGEMPSRGSQNSKPLQGNMHRG